MPRPLHSLAIAVALFGPAAAQGFVDVDAEPVFEVHPPLLDAGFAVGDFDGDQRPDLVVRGGHVFFNRGGYFATPAQAQVSASNSRPPTPTVPFDVDLDGDLDVWSHGMWLNDGNGVLTDVTASRVLPGRAGIDAFDAGVLDVDGNGFPDLLLATPTGAVVLENRNGVLHDATIARIGSFALSAFGVLDFNQDGRLDVATWDGLLLWNDPTRGVLVPVSNIGLVPGGPRPVGDDVRIADLDGDGRDDVIVGSTVLRNTGFGFGPGQALPPSLAGGRILAVADFDGDGVLDLLVVGLRDPQPGDIAPAVVLRGDPNRGFPLDRAVPVADPPAWHQGATVFDLDGDGDLDLVFALRDRALVFRNDGDARLRRANPPRLDVVFPGVTESVWTDLDGDGDVDALTARHFDLRNDGQGTFTSHYGWAIGAGARTAGLVPLTAGDVDGDGDQDVVARDLDRLLLLVNRGDGSFDPPTTARLDAAAHGGCALLVDVDDDGALDLVHGTRVPTAADRLYTNDGRGNFTLAAGRIDATPTATSVLALGDLDGDGDLDVVCAPPLAVLVNDGSGGFPTRVRVPGTSPANLATLDLADIDGDGDLDIAVGSRLLTNLGSLTFRDDGIARGVPADRPYGLFADVDDDGDPDLVTSRQVAQLWLNDGRGRFAERPGAIPDPLQGRSPPVVTTVAVVDLDGDGDPDLAVGGEHGTGALVIDRHRQLSSPGEPVPGGIQTWILHAAPGYRTAPAVAVLLVAAVPTHLEVPGIGTLGLDPRSLVPFPPVSIPAPAGEVRLVLPVPAVPSLVGARVFAQALIADGARLALTGRVEDTVR